jgi:lysyl-tRNA synthetase class I
LEVADPEIYRTLILRTNPMKHISLRMEEIPQYHDYYEKMENIFYEIEKTESKEEFDYFNYLYPLTKIKDVPTHKPSRIPLKLLTFLSQMQNILTANKLYEKAISSMRTSNDESVISFETFLALLKRTENWINEVNSYINSLEDQKAIRNIKNKIEIFTIPETVDRKLISHLSDDQINGLKKFRDFIADNDHLDADSIQNKIFTIAKKELEIPPRKMFEALYLLLLSSKSGPRLGTFILMLDKPWLMNRLNQLF